MRETRNLEFKETITSTFLKTVSAFSNYDGGTILFGIDDDGNVIALVHLDVERFHCRSAFCIGHTVLSVPDGSLKSTSKNHIFVAILRCSQKISPYISNICCVEIFCSCLVSLRN